MPNQRVANGVHIVRLAELNVTIRPGEIVLSWLWVDGFPLQNIFRGNGVKLRLDNRSTALIFLEELRLVDRDTDEKIVFIGVLQRQ